MFPGTHFNNSPLATMAGEYVVAWMSLDMEWTSLNVYDVIWGVAHAQDDPCSIAMMTHV